MYKSTQFKTLYNIFVTNFSQAKRSSFVCSFFFLITCIPDESRNYPTNPNSAISAAFFFSILIRKRLSDLIKYQSTVELRYLNTDNVSRIQ